MRDTKPACGLLIIPMLLDRRGGQTQGLPLQKSGILNFPVTDL
ncbi:hypothetical protein [Geosporobacter ferrireducens]|nr:hypothetical protein [Geosporobacter ferrireducens]